MESRRSKQVPPRKCIGGFEHSVITRRSKQDVGADIAQQVDVGGDVLELDYRGETIKIPLPAEAKMEFGSYPLPGLVSFSFVDRQGRELFALVTSKNGAVSFVASLVEAGLESHDFLDELLRYRAEAGDFSPLIAQLRKDLPATRAQLVIDIIEKKLRRPRHCPAKSEPYIRELSIVRFIGERVDKEGIPLPEAKVEAMRTFKISKTVLWRALKKFGHWG